MSSTATTAQAEPAPPPPEAGGDGDSPRGALETGVLTGRPGETEAEIVAYRTPRWTIVGGGVAGVVLLLTALGGVGLAVVEAATGAATQAVWWALVFQSVAALAGFFAALLLFGRFKSGPVLTMFSCGVCALATLPLMEPGIVFALLGAGGTTMATVAGVPLTVVAAASGGPAAALVLLAGLGTFLRDPVRTIPRFWAGLGLLAIPGIAYIVVGVPTSSPFGSGPGGAALTAVVATVGFAMLLAIVAAGVHLVARSIEIGIDAGAPDRPVVERRVKVKSPTKAKAAKPAK